MLHAMPADDDAQERTPGGQPIYRYEDGPISDEFEPSIGDDELMAAVDQRLKTAFAGGARQVFHEILSPTVHLDVHLVPPGDVIDAWVCVTTGMAERPMSPPGEALPDHAADRWAELVTVLPPDWPLFAGEKHKLVGGEDGPPDAAYWPIGWMKFLARFPHEYGAWFWLGHTVPNGDPAEPFDGTRFVGSMFVDAGILHEELSVVRAGDRDVRLMQVLPLTQAEMDYKLRHGADALLDKFDAADVGPVMDVEPPGRRRPAETPLVAVRGVRRLPGRRPRRITRRCKRSWASRCSSRRSSAGAATIRTCRRRSRCTPTPGSSTSARR